MDIPYRGSLRGWVFKYIASAETKTSPCVLNGLNNEKNWTISKRQADLNGKPR